MQKEQNKNNKDNMMKSQTNAFSKFCKYNIKKYDIKDTHIMQGPYNKTVGDKTLHYYESFLNARNSSTE
jgi:hypothetical protein